MNSVASCDQLGDQPSPNSAQISLASHKSVVPQSYTFQVSELRNKAQVDSAPFFPEVLEQFYKFLIKHNLVDEETGERSARFCWCSDGPFDVRDFVVKQCFISRVGRISDSYPRRSSCTYELRLRSQCPNGLKAMSLMSECLSCNG